jgi:hypothetical protein
VIVTTSTAGQPKSRPNPFAVYAANQLDMKFVSVTSQATPKGSAIPVVWKSFTEFESYSQGSKKHEKRDTGERGLKK